MGSKTKIKCRAFFPPQPAHDRYLYRLSKKPCSSAGFDALLRPDTPVALPAGVGGDLCVRRTSTFPRIEYLRAGTSHILDITGDQREVVRYRGGRDQAVNGTASSRSDLSRRGFVAAKVQFDALEGRLPQELDERVLLPAQALKVLEGHDHDRRLTVAGDSLVTLVDCQLDEFTQPVLCFLQLPGAFHGP